MTQLLPPGEPPPDLADLLTTRQAAALIGIHVVTLHRWIAAGRVNRYYVGARLRFDRAEIAGLVQAAPARRRGPKARHVPTTNRHETAPKQG